MVATRSGIGANGQAETQAASAPAIAAATLPLPLADTLWYKNAIVYSLDVEIFKDGDGDGVGDFQGLTQSIEHLAALGVTCVWLLPFYPSPNRDNGYDVMDYYNVDPRLGSLGDFVEFMQQAQERGIRVLIDLVINHTSNQHPWFQSARCDRNSKYYSYYVWSDNPPQTDPEQLVFPDEEDSIWEYESAVNSYYLHHFYKEQPELNIANPEVQAEILKIMGFWLKLGVSGFRVDAAPYVIETKGLEGIRSTDLEAFFERMRQFLSQRRGDAVLLAEANVAPEQISLYFGAGDRMHLLFNFLLNQDLFLALARQHAGPLQQDLRLSPQIPAQQGDSPEIPVQCQWLNFVRHHDELTLDQISEAEKQEIFAAFAPEPEMQIYGRGVRRRLPPMMQGDRRRIELTYSLTFSLPGIPLIRYGDEIGMGDNLSLAGRTSVRTPMQWSSDRNGGFSSAAPEDLVVPVIASGEYGYTQVNVADQLWDPTSLMHWIRRLVWLRRQCPEIGWGTWEILPIDVEQILLHRCRWQGKEILVLHNLAEQPCTVTLPAIDTENLLEIFSNTMSFCQPIQTQSVDRSQPEITLESYGYRWFRVIKQ